MNDRWVQVTLPGWNGACFALRIRDGHVVEAPPIMWRTLQWLGTSEVRVARYLRSKGATFAEF